jgi:hypothetical protein
VMIKKISFLVDKKYKIRPLKINFILHQKVLSFGKDCRIG